VKRFWVSWYEPMLDGDYRPRRWPLPVSVPHYWCSGMTGDGAFATLCAIVDVPTCCDVEAAVRSAGWTPGVPDGEESAVRFCDERPAGWMPDAGRFPLRPESLS